MHQALTAPSISSRRAFDLEALTERAIEDHLSASSASLHQEMIRVQTLHVHKSGHADELSIHESTCAPRGSSPLQTSISALLAAAGEDDILIHSCISQANAMRDAWYNRGPRTANLPDILAEVADLYEEIEGFQEDVLQPVSFVLLSYFEERNPTRRTPVIEELLGIARELMRARIADLSAHQIAELLYTRGTRPLSAPGPHSSGSATQVAPSGGPQGLVWVSGDADCTVTLELWAKQSLRRGAEVLLLCSPSEARTIAQLHEKMYSNTHYNHLAWTPVEVRDEMGPTLLPVVMGQLPEESDPGHLSGESAPEALEAAYQVACDALTQL